MTAYGNELLPLRVGGRRSPASAEGLHSVGVRQVRRSPTGSAGLHLSLFGDFQRVVDLDSEVSHGAFKFRMAEQELNGPEIPGAAIDQSRLGSPH